MATCILPRGARRMHLGGIDPAIHIGDATAIEAAIL
jgi:hypothetical protein